jgi:uncharacterized membrane protein YfcA
LDPATIIAGLIAAVIFVFAVLYSNTGEDAAPGFLAAMALYGMNPLTMKPAALSLTVIVALVSTIRFYRSDFFSWRTFWPFAAASIPASVLGANLGLSDFFYRMVVSLVLLYSAARLIFSGEANIKKKTAGFPIPLALLLGAAIGLLSGLAGVGGGIFLSPLLLMGSSRADEVRGVSAAFVLVNSMAGLIVSGPTVPFLLSDMVYWAPAALVGAWIGTELDMRAMPVVHIRQGLSLILVVGALRLLSGML